MEGMKLEHRDQRGQDDRCHRRPAGGHGQARRRHLEETTIAISDELDEIEEDLDAIEDFIMDEDDDDDEDYDDEDEWDDDEDSATRALSSATRRPPFTRSECPSCGEVVDFDEETAGKGKHRLPQLR